MEVGNEPCSIPSLNEVADGVSPTELQENRRSKRIWEGKNLIGFRHTEFEALVDCPHEGVSDKNEILWRRYRQLVKDEDFRFKRDEFTFQLCHLPVR